MKTIKNVILFFIVTLTMYSCSSPKLGKDRLDLEKFDLNFDVDAFYADEIKKGKENMKELEKLEEKREKEGFSEKARKELVKKAWKLLKFKSIEKDTIFNAQFYEDERSPIGYQYDMWGWNSADSLANYHKMHFHKINMATSLEGDFMALVAQSQGEGTEDFEALLRYLEQKHGKVMVKEKNFFRNFPIYYWELDDRLLAMISKQQKQANLILKLSKEATENNPTTDTISFNTTHLFILNNQYKHDSIISNFRSGDWIDFNAVLKK
ncbi:hypothetical protein [Capnocytophaga canis]|uniref:Lipoprotein n=1 Tax=Capnocytophaga canis TaxID=1848903 RepID=A0A0B7IF89_9FLAO|nr:hypothetical protein [Capnocytophaga canis]CEN50445.1 conserved exported hypothetical protein [Capnocytophaga canis]